MGQDAEMGVGEGRISPRAGGVHWEVVLEVYSVLIKYLFH